MNKFFLLLLGLLFIYFFPQIPVRKTIQDQKIVKINYQETARVLRVIDGDTIKVWINNKEETVRLIGIDAPETVDPRKPVQCFGREASDKAKEVLTGKIITLESDPTQADRDKYGRFLRYVFIGDLNINKLMISEGYAHEYTYRSNPYKYQEEFKSAEKTAREESKGLWDKNICKNPEVSS